MTQIDFATTAEDVARCFPVMQQLRPHLVESEFVARIDRMRPNGFLLAALEDDGVVRAVAGFRYLDLLFCGKAMYVDDLVTDAATRSKGYGSAMLDWLRDQATANECTTFTLDSGVQRYDAHRFYFRERMTIHGYHFTQPIEPKK
jgi:GNAT superfamily N-acetyltransferase